MKNVSIFGWSYDVSWLPRETNRPLFGLSKDERYTIGHMIVDTTVLFVPKYIVYISRTKPKVR